jgi:sulfur carrier protein
MTILVNGRPLTGPETVAQAVAVTMDAPARIGIAVAVNGEVVPRSEWAGHALRDGDRVEILTAAQGG